MDVLIVAGIAIFIVWRIFRFSTKKRYVPQQMFDLCVYTAIRAYLAERQDETTAMELQLDTTAMRKLCSPLARSSLGGYNDEGNPEHDVYAAAYTVYKHETKDRPDPLPPDDQIEVQHDVLCLQYAAVYYWPDGRKRERRRILGGTMFNYESEEIEDKVAHCAHNTSLYFQAIHRKFIPLAPDDWSILDA